MPSVARRSAATNGALHCLNMIPGHWETALCVGSFFISNVRQLQVVDLHLMLVPRYCGLTFCDV